MSPVVERLAELRRHLERVVRALDRLEPLEEFLEAVRRIEGGRT